MAFVAYRSVGGPDSFGLAAHAGRPESHRIDEEIWDAESLAERWGLDPSVLGYGQAGTDMEDRVARSMTFPPKATLQEYARRAFAAVEGVFGTVEDDR